MTTKFSSIKSLENIGSFSTNSQIEPYNEGEFFSTTEHSLNKYSLNDHMVVDSVPLQNSSILIKYVPSRNILCSITQDFHLDVYDAQTLEFLTSHRLNSKALRATAVDRSACGSILAIGTLESSVTLWNLESNEILSSLKKISAHPVSYLKFFKIGSEEHLAICNSANEVLICDVKSKALKACLDKHLGPVNHVSVAGDCLLCFSADKTISIWSLKSSDEWSCTRIFPCYQSIKSAVQLNDHEYLLSSDDQLFMFNFESAAALSFEPVELSMQGNISQLTKFDTRVLITFHGSYFQVLDTGDLSLREKFLGHFEIATRIEKLFEDSKDWIVFINTDSTFVCLNLANRSQRFFPIDHDSTINGFKILPGQRQIICFCSNGTLLVYSYADFEHSGIEFVAECEISKSSIECVDISGAANPIVASGGRDGILKLSKFSTNAEKASCSQLATIKAHGKAINQVLFGHKAKTVITAGQDRTIKVWAADTLVNLGTMSGHKRAINQICVTEDNHLISGSLDGVLRMWSLSNYSCMKTFTEVTDSKHVMLHTLGPKFFLSATASGFLHVWSVQKQLSAKSHNFARGDQVYHNSLVLDEEHMLTASQNEIAIWRDTTKEDEAAELEQRVRQTEQNQKMMNLINENRLSEAFVLLIEFKMYQNLVEATSALEDSEITKIFGEITDETLAKTMQVLNELNKIRKYRFSAQRLLNLLLRTVPQRRLTKIGNLDQIIDSLLSYTLRHAGRIEELVMHSHFINFAANMDKTISRPAHTPGKAPQRPPMPKKDLKPNNIMPVPGPKAKKRKNSRSQEKKLDDVGLFLMQSSKEGSVEL